MNLSSETSTASDTGTDFDTDDLFEILADRRRRYTVHYLKQVDGQVSIRDLAEQVAAWENEKAVTNLEAQERKRVYISLYQSHLTTLAEKGVIKYDQERGTAALADTIAKLDIYLEIVPQRNIPWGHYYCGLTVANVGFLILAWFEVGLLENLPGLGVATSIVAMFGISALVHLFQSERMKLGDEGPPPELRRT